MAKKIRYTRYADDITFSGEFDPKEIEEFVKKELEILKLFLNDDKRSIMKKSDRQIVTGVVVNEKMQVKRSERKDIRQVIHYIDKFGLVNHMQYIDLTKARYLDHLLGRINFILFINGDDKEFLGYRNFIIQKKKEAN